MSATIYHHTRNREIKIFFGNAKKKQKRLLETFSDTIVMSVVNKDHAHKVLKYLERTYEAKNLGNLVAIHEEFVSLKYKDGQKMTEHLITLKTLI